MNYKIFYLILAFILINGTVGALDWPQFQMNEVNTGATTDSAPTAPELEWRSSTLKGMIDVTPIVAQDKVFVLSAGGYITSYNKTTGNEIWNKSFASTGGGSIGFETSTPAFADGKIFFATAGGEVKCMYANNGSEIWSVDYSGAFVNESFQTPVTLADGKVFVATYKQDEQGDPLIGHYVALNQGTGESIWNFTAPSVQNSYNWNGAAYVEDSSGNGLLIFGDCRGNLRCLYTENGNQKWNIALGGTNEIRSSIVFNDDKIYFTSRTSSTGHVRCYAYDPETDTQPTYKWSREIGYTTSTPTYYGGRVYVGSGQQSGSGGLYCINATNGNQIWNITGSGYAAQASPVISVQASDPYIYFTTNVANGSAYCADEDGNIVWGWNPPAPDEQYILQGMVISDGRVYFGTDYGYLYCLKQGNKDLVIDDIDTGWPTNCDLIVYTIKNAGQITVESGHKTALYVNDTKVAEDTVTFSLDPDDSLVRSFPSYTWSYGGIRDKIRVIADFYDAVDEEEDEGNNDRTEYWKCGDIDQSGTVNVIDVIELFNEISAGIYHDGWAADVTRGEGVTIIDVIELFNKVSLGQEPECGC